jgi:hypothetical protein
MVGTAATCVTPFGAGVWAYAAAIGADPVITGRVSEWQRTSPLSVTGALFYFSVAGVAAVAWRGRARLVWPDAAWLGGLALIGAWAVRGAAWWPAGAVLVAAAALAVSEGSVTSLRPVPAVARRLNTLVAAALGLAVVVALPWWRPADPLTGRTGLLAYAPSALAAWLRANATPGAHVFVPQVWGSWFEWAAPGQLYFVDSRFELFPADVWDDNDAIASGGSGAAGPLAQRGVTVVVLATGWVAPAGAWTVAYTDADGMILVGAPVR